MSGLLMRKWVITGKDLSPRKQARQDGAFRRQEVGVAPSRGHFKGSVALVGAGWRGGGHYLKVAPVGAGWRLRWVLPPCGAGQTVVMRA